ncbi:MAG: TIGR03790 family protein [Candidatus Omnitrophota bacterium]
MKYFKILLTVMVITNLAIGPVYPQSENLPQTPYNTQTELSDNVDLITRLKTAEVTEGNNEDLYLKKAYFFNPRRALGLMAGYGAYESALPAANLLRRYVMPAAGEQVRPDSVSLLNLLNETPIRSIYYIPLNASQGGVDTNILDWEITNNADILGYNIYRREFGTDEWSFITDNGMKPRYLDKNIDTSRAYQYEVRPYTAESELTSVTVKLSANYEDAYNGLQPENILVLVNTADTGLVDIGEIVEDYENALGMLDPITEGELRDFLGVSQDDLTFFSEVDESGIAYNAAWHIQKDTSTGKIEVPLGLYYAMRRNIPKENIVFLDNIPLEERAYMTDDDYQKYVIDPIVEHMVEKGIQARIGSVASAYRFPVSISNGVTPLFSYSDAVAWEDQLNHCLYSALGGNVADLQEALGHERHFSRVLGDAGFLATRIDAADIANARRMIDDAIWAEASYHFADPDWRAESGLKAFIDWGGPYDMVDRWFLEAADILNDSGLFGEQGENWDMAANLNDIISEYDADGDGRLDDTFLYSGWYNYLGYQDWFDWARGSIGWSFDSGSGYSFRENEAAWGEAWGANIINRGACASLGAVAEPTALCHTQPQLFTYYILNGYSFAEAAYYASRIKGGVWTYAFNGDPLYNPFGSSSSLHVSRVESHGEMVDRVTLTDGYWEGWINDLGYASGPYRDYDLDGNLIRECLADGSMIGYPEDGKTIFYESGYLRIYDTDGELSLSKGLPIPYGLAVIEEIADVNGDGIVNAEDISFIEDFYSTTIEYYNKYYKYLPEGIVRRFDCNHDGDVDGKDRDIFSQFIAKMRDELRCDINQDGKVDFADYQILEAVFGDENFDPRCDINQDGKVDFADYQILKAAFGDGPQGEEGSASPPTGANYAKGDEEEVLERKTVEEEIADMRDSGGNYTIIGEIADRDEDGLPLNGSQ